MNEKNELHNRSLHISGLWNEEKVDIERMFSEKTKDFSVKTMIHIHRLFKEYGYEEVFGRSTIMEDVYKRQCSQTAESSGKPGENPL